MSSSMNVAKRQRKLNAQREQRCPRAQAAIFSDPVHLEDSLLQRYRA